MLPGSTLAGWRAADVRHCAACFSSVRCPPRTVANKKRILFVCTGNICRSPMAEGLMRHATRNRDDIEIASAGVATGYGQMPSEYGIEVLRHANIDISKIRSQPLNDELV